MEDFKTFKNETLHFHNLWKSYEFKNHKWDFSYNLRTSYKNTFYEQLLDQFGSKTNYHIIFLSI